LRSGALPNFYLSWSLRCCSRKRGRVLRSSTLSCPPVTDAPQADVRFARVTKRYGSTVAVRDLTLDIPRGMFFSLLGPSGCGKTTTLRLVAGFEQPEEGDVFIRNERVTSVPPFRRNFAMVFQNFALFPHFNVSENVAFGLKMLRVPQAERAEQVRNALSLV